MQHKVSFVTTYELYAREHEAVKGKQHRDPRKETVGPGPFEDQVDTSPHELCKAAKEIIRLWECSKKKKKKVTIVLSNNDRRISIQENLICQIMDY